MEYLSDDLLRHILSLVPEEEGPLDVGAQGGSPCLSTRAGAEWVSRRWRRLCLSLPASQLRLDWSHDGMDLDMEPGYGAALLAALGGRRVLHIQLAMAPGGLPQPVWDAIGSLVAQAHSLTVQYQDAPGALPPGSCRACASSPWQSAGDC
ncbi:hypothetical protein ABPG75_004121 [Micractinium tetrahymenae]